MSQELRGLFRSWVFRGLFGIAMLNVLGRVIQILIFDIIAANPDNPAILTLKNADVLVIEGKLFLNFIRSQGPIVFITTILVGSGMICNDVRNNLLEIYFSKPITWRDYVLGKSMALIAVGLLMTAVPVLAMILLHNLFLPGWETLAMSWEWALSGMIFSLAVVVPCALCVLASSALFQSQRFAAIAIFMLLLANSTIGAVIPGILRERDLAILAYPVAVDHIGEHVFEVQRMLVSLHWRYSFVYLTVVCLVALFIVCRKVRRAEIAQ